MSKSGWSLQDAKNRFSAVVDAAQRGEPQMVTRRGVPTVMVISVEAYEQLCQSKKTTQPSFVDHLFAIPQDDGEFERMTVTPRDLFP
ncbi:MAG: type II toxin-antitoxin system Phd/YefM family antitoxin [Magnetococcus sp. DMHC-1]